MHKSGKRMGMELWKKVQLMGHADRESEQERERSSSSWDVLADKQYRALRPKHAQTALSKGTTDFR